MTATLTASDRFHVRLLTSCIGAEVEGVDLSRPLDADQVASIRALLLDHLVIFFPDQQVDPPALRALGRSFGELTSAHPVLVSHAEHPEILELDNAAGHRSDFWHTDVTYVDRPPLGSLLAAKELPVTGGDTMWANLRAAYDGLSAPIRRLVGELTAAHDVRCHRKRPATKAGASDAERAREAALPPVEHPVVRTHPETGRPNLFVNPGWTDHLVGLSARESTALLNLLYEHSTRPEYVVRHSWRAGDVAFWDNRATMHYALYDYADARRVVHRVTLEGDRPR